MARNEPTSVLLRDRVQALFARALPVLTLAAACAPSGCGSKPAESVVLYITAEPLLGQQINNLEIIHNHGGQEGSQSTFLGSEDGSKLPGSIVFYDNFHDNVSPNTETRLQLRATFQGNRDKSYKIVRDVIIDRLTEDQRVVNVALRYACSRIDEEKNGCQKGQTCIAGACQSAKVSSSDLQRYDQKVVFPVKGQDACFDDDEQHCFAQPHDVAADTLTVSDSGQETAKRCYLDAPGLSKNALNVALRWDADPNRYFTLDLDDSVTEGWTYEKGKIVLPYGYCEAGKNVEGLRPPTKLLSVRYSTACAPKTPTLYSCQPETNAFGAPVDGAKIDAAL